MQPIQVYYQMVENVIKELGVDPALCRGQNLGQWNMKLGSASVWIDVFQSKDQNGNFIDGGYFQMMAPVLDVPTERQGEFFQELLEINHNLYGVAFTKFQNGIYIKSIRELDNLEQSEVMATFNRVGRYADQYDDVLKAKYAGAGRAPQ